MRAGDIKKFLDDIISENQPNPQQFNINDNFILDAVNAYRKGDPAEHLETLINGFINTEKLTVERRCSVLRMVRDVLVGMSVDNSEENRERLRGLLTAYYI